MELNLRKLLKINNLLLLGCGSALVQFPVFIWMALNPLMKENTVAGESFLFFIGGLLTAAVFVGLGAVAILAAVADTLELKGCEDFEEHGEMKHGL